LPKPQNHYKDIKSVMKNFAAMALASTMLVGTLAAGLISAPAASAAPSPASITAGVGSVPASNYSDTFAKQTFDLMNAERIKVGSRPLVWNQKVADVSQDWANQLGVKTQSDTFDWATIHRSDAGGSLIPAGASMYREIIGFNFTPAQIVQWWMGSASHKAAMLHPSATDAGLGYVVPASGPYTGWHLVVSNLAGYTTTTAPTPAPVLPASSTSSLKAIDTGGTLWGYSAPGNTTLGSRTSVGSGWSSAKQIISVDWNSDGKLDIVARWANGYVTMYAGLGGDDYKAPINIGSGGWQDYDITATKLRSSDAYPGLVARDTVGGNLYYYPNTTGGAMTAPRTMIGNGGWSPMSEINALDWDRDGKMDLIVRNPAGELLLYRTNGIGTIIDEARKSVDYGWNVMDSISAEPNFAGPGSVGLIARTTYGTLLYYPIINGKVGASTMIGNGGWTGYVIAAGVPTV
jgi:uncharacterized protein YkwD